MNFRFKEGSFMINDSIRNDGVEILNKQINRWYDGYTNIVFHHDEYL